MESQMLFDHGLGASLQLQLPLLLARHLSSLPGQMTNIEQPCRCQDMPGEYRKGLQVPDASGAVTRAAQA